MRALDLQIDALGVDLVYINALGVFLFGASCRTSLRDVVFVSFT